MTIGMEKILAAIAAAKAKKEAAEKALEAAQDELDNAEHAAIADKLRENFERAAASIPKSPNVMPWRLTPAADAPVKAFVTVNPTDDPAPMHQWVDEELVAAPMPATPTNIFLDGKEFNAEQSEAIRRVAAGESICMIGAAGTGKTTTTHGMAHYLMEKGLGSIGNNTKYLAAEAPGVVILSFTRRAVANIKRQMPDDLKGNTLTFHKILEYAPVIYEEYDPEKGKIVKKRRFEPKRNRTNPLPAGIKVVIVEETSMLEIPLFMNFMDALPYPDRVQWVFLGDINQLPPVFGKSIFGFKLLELPVVELTQIYRQALESPGLRLAHAIKNGTVIPSETEKNRHVSPKGWHHPGKLTIRYWQRDINEDEALITAYGFLKKGIQDGYYDPQQDMVLVPFNKKFGSIELGNYLANYLGKERGAVVHEIIAGFNKHYLAVGDKMMYDKEDCIIENITINESYMGADFQAASEHMDRWGVVDAPSDHKPEIVHTGPTDVTDIDFLLQQADINDRVHAASHRITLRMLGMANDEDDERIVTIDTAADINKLISGHVMTVHKSQGCEWRRVFVFFHRSHNIMASREILYTACTRFREELVMIIEPDRGTPGTKSHKPGTLHKGVLTQHIPGNNLQEKLSHFQEAQLEALAQLKNEEDKNEVAKLLFIVGNKIKDRIREQVKQYEDKVRDAVRDVFDRLVANDPANRYIPRYEVLIDTSFGDAAGTAQARPGTSIITIDSAYLLKNPEECLTRTVPHEVCHIADACWQNGTGHGPGWKKLMKELGFVPDKEIFHHMGTRQQAMQTIAKGM